MWTTASRSILDKPERRSHLQDWIRGIRSQVSGADCRACFLRREISPKASPRSGERHGCTGRTDHVRQGGRTKEAPPVSRRGLYIVSCTLFRVECRRRPTLPHPGECSTIGAGGLSFRVRDGTGRSPLRQHHRQHYSPIPPARHKTGRPGESNTPHHPHTPPNRPRVGVDHGCVLRVTQWMRTTMLRASPRPISTGQLHPSQGFHPRPINPIVSRGP